MSVITTADEKRDEAKEYIRLAKESLKVSIDNDTWGSNEFSEEYYDKLENTILILIKALKGI